MLKRIVGRTAIVPDNDEKTWPTEVPRYDDKIRAAIRGWRYEPFLVDGQPSRVCTHTTVIYSQS